MRTPLVWSNVVPLTAAVFMASSAPAAIVVLGRTATLQTVADTSANGGGVSQYANSSMTLTGTFVDSSASGTDFTPPALGAYATAAHNTAVAASASSLIVSGEGSTSGRARGTPAPNFITATSRLEVRFDVTDTPANYALAGTAFRSLAVTGNNGQASALVALYQVLPGDSLSLVAGAVASNPNTGTPVSVDTVGTLGVGSYSVVFNAVRATTPTGGNQPGALYEAYFDDASLSVTSVPEPTIAAALAFALPLVRRRRRN